MATDVLALADGRTPIAITPQDFATGVFIDAWNQPDTNFLIDELAPELTVAADEDKLLEADGSAQIAISTARTPGEPPDQVRTGFIEGVQYRLVDHALTEVIPDVDERRAKRFNQDAIERATLALVQRGKIEQELMVAGLFTSRAALPTDANGTRAVADYGYYADYTNQLIEIGGSDQWTDAGSHPFAHLQSGIDAIEAVSPVEPNTIIINRAAARALREHADWKAEYGNAGDQQPRTAAEMEQMTIRGMRVLIHRGTYKPSPGVSRSIWPNDCWIGRLEPYSKLYTGFALRAVLEGENRHVTVKYDEDRKTTYIAAWYGTYDILVAKKGGSISGAVLTGVI